MSRGATPFPAEGFRKLLEAEALREGVPFREPTLAALGRYLAELDAWRQRINLTGDLAPEDLAVHAFESAAGAPLIPEGTRVLDIGSGGGLPGIPLAIVRPDLTVTALEPRRKRAAFLRHVLRSVPVANAEVLEDRVERLDRSSWAVATVRAVGSLGELVGRAPFLAAGGRLLAWTTDAEALSRELAPHLVFDRSLPLPRSERRTVAVFRRAD